MRNNIQVVGSSGEETRDMMALWGPIRIWALMLKKCDVLYIVPKGRKRIKTFTYKLKMYIIREDAFVVRLAQMVWAHQEHVIPHHAGVIAETGRPSRGT